VPEADVEIQIYHARKAHEEWLGKYYHKCADSEVVENTVGAAKHTGFIFIRQPEYGPVPEQVEEKKQHGERIIDAATIVLFRFQFFSANLTFILQLNQLPEREHAFIHKHVAFPATGAFHGQHGGKNGWLFFGRHGAKLIYFPRFIEAD
jgi:hypothetical protein